MNKKVRELTKDAILLAILEVLIILVIYFFNYMDSVLLLVISAVIGVYFFKEKSPRMIIFSLCTLLISFLYTDILDIIVYILPGVIIGNIAHYLLKIVSNFKYYILTIFLYFIFHSFVEILYARLIMKIDFIEYLNVGMEVPLTIVENVGITGLLLIFFGFNLIIAIMESFIIRRIVFLVEYRKINSKRKRLRNI